MRSQRMQLTAKYDFPLRIRWVSFSEHAQLIQYILIIYLVVRVNYWRGHAHSRISWPNELGPRVTCERQTLTFCLLWISDVRFLLYHRRRRVRITFTYNVS